MLSKLILATVSLAVAAVSATPLNVTNPFLGKRAPAQIITKCTVPKTVALTFDDGPFVYLYDISKALIAAGAKGTFFFNGNNFGCIYDEDQVKRVKYAFDKGHQVASHTWSHAHLTTLSFDNLHNHFWLVEEALLKITGAYPAFARAPYGETNALVQQVAGQRGQDLVNWDFDSGDTWGITTDAQKQRYVDIVNTHPNTILTLNHEVHQQTAQVLLPFAIKTLQDAGYKLVTVAECLGRQPYQSVTTPSTRDATWTCAGKPTP